MELSMILAIARAEIIGIVCTDNVPERALIQNAHPRGVERIDELLSPLRRPFGRPEPGRCDQQQRKGFRKVLNSLIH